MLVQRVPIIPTNNQKMKWNKEERETGFVSDRNMMLCVYVSECLSLSA